MIDDRKSHKVHRRRADEFRYEHVHRTPVQLPWNRALLQDTVAQHRDAIAHGHCLDLVVGDVDGGDAQSPLESGNLIAGLHP